jgi:hypothetical protein
MLVEALQRSYLVLCRLLGPPPLCSRSSEGGVSSPPRTPLPLLLAAPSYALACSLLLGVVGRRSRGPSSCHPQRRSPLATAFY